jgi:porphobilinogen synthase
MAIKYGRPIESRVRVVPAEAKGRPETAPPLALNTRLRRNRRTEWARPVVTEEICSGAALVASLKGRCAGRPMPGVDRCRSTTSREVERAPTDDLASRCFLHRSEWRRAWREPNADPLQASHIDVRGRCCATWRSTLHHHGLTRMHVKAPSQRRDRRGAGEQAPVQAEAGCDIIAPWT